MKIKGNLTGKVVVVTGASSGIGQQYSDPEKMLQPEEMTLAIITAMEMPEKIAFNTMVVRPVNS